MARLKAAIDKNLPVCIPHTLNGWCQRYDELRTGRQDDSDDAALVFALTGCYTEDIGGVETKARAQLDFTDRALRPSLGIHQISDIDSVIGIITDEFPIQDDAVFEYHLINDVRYCLQSDLHIPGWLDTSTQGHTNEVSVLFDSILEAGLMWPVRTPTATSLPKDPTCSFWHNEPGSDGHSDILS
jgi:hypothetical protein